MICPRAGSSGATNKMGAVQGAGSGLRPGPLCAALVWNVSDIEAVLSVPFGPVCSPVTDKTAPLSAPVRTALQNTEVQGAGYPPRESNETGKNRRKIYRFYLHSGYVFAIIYRHDLRGQYALRKETMKGGLYCEG